VGQGSPEVEPFSPENLLIFGTGLLTGTPAPGANRHNHFHNLTPNRPDGLFDDGRLFCPELKYAGYDKNYFPRQIP